MGELVRLQTCLFLHMLVLNFMMTAFPRVSIATISD